MNTLVRYRNIAWILLALFSLAACRDTAGPDCDDCPTGELIVGEYAPEPVELAVPDSFPRPLSFPDNPLTKAGIELGRRLFYDPILSSNNSMSCASCHNQSLAFTDGVAKSTGVTGAQVERNSMMLANLAFNPNGFFWDGRVATLEEQALLPVEDHRELNESWDNVERKLREDPNYPRLFRAAFGIERTGEVTRDLAVQAIAQFERTLISGNSPYDRARYYNEGFLPDEVVDGEQLFFIEFSTTNQAHPGCSHCHNAPLFGDNQFKNNGLDSVGSLLDFVDLGRGGVNGNVFDNGKFRTPSLRNVAVTAPYMHDGRFATLEEVLDNYARGGHGVENEDPNIIPFTLTPAEKRALIAFLHSLTDESFLTNPAFSDPF